MRPVATTSAGLLDKLVSKIFIRCFLNEHSLQMLFLVVLNIPYGMCGDGCGCGGGAGGGN